MLNCLGDVQLPVSGRDFRSPDYRTVELTVWGEGVPLKPRLFSGCIFWGGEESFLKWSLMPEGFLAMEVFFIAGVDQEPSGDALVAKQFVWALLAIASGYRSGMRFVVLWRIARRHARNFQSFRVCIGSNTETAWIS